MIIKEKRMRHKQSKHELPRFVFEIYASGERSFAPRVPEDQTNSDKLNELKKYGYFGINKDEREEFEKEIDFI